MTYAPPPPAAEQPLPPPPPARPQLRRSGTDKIIGGVCGGLAQYSGIDPLLWRVGAVGLTLIGPGLFLYLLLWVLMEPPADVPQEQLSGLDRLVGDLHDRLTGRRQAPPAA